MAQAPQDLGAALDETFGSMPGLEVPATGIATPDALIAATALTHGIALMTRHRRHFDRVAALHVVGHA